MTSANVVRTAEINIVLFRMTTPLEQKFLGEPGEDVSQIRVGMPTLYMACIICFWLNLIGLGKMSLYVSQSCWFDY